MTHVSESTYQDRVEEWLIGEYGEDNVERNKYLNEPDVYDEGTIRFCDFWVEGPVCTFAIEVENDFDACWKGKTQAEIYSKFDSGAVPVIFIPPGHVEEPEVSMMRESILIKELGV